ncbi:MAG: Uma2 family endonuclease [Planctomycetes bacterium]|nr:Uma2 family endonuclease [Planctomycetota bacterium]
MSSQAPATIENLCRVAGKAELVDGQIVSIAPGGGWQGHAVGNILASLSARATETGVGHPVGGNAAFVVDLPHRKSFSPDAAFYTGELTMKFLEGAPVFAVEVRSEGDYGPQAEAAMAQKRADYFAAGTLVVWDVDLLSEDVVRVYRPDQPKQPTIYRRDDIADAEPAVPGWSMPVRDMLPPESA